MKRTSLTTAVIAGIAGVAGISNMASAVFLNTDGLGEVLIYPYYTVNGGNTTLMSVVNTTSQGKAVKVRFLEAYDSREVLDFNLYLSQFDVWVAEIVPTGGGAGIDTPDKSCTVPPLPGSGSPQPFLTYAFDGSLSAVLLSAATDNGPTDVSRTLEGYIELIEMGVVLNSNGAQPAQNTLKAITHVAGVPPGCAQVNAAWGGGGYWASGNVNTDLTSPSGGLFGSASIINVNAGGIAGYNADAIDSFYTPASGPQQSAPTDLFPSLTNGTSFTSYVFANGALVTTTFTNSADAVSSLFMADSVYNEYVTAPSIGASTEWVVTFPTKRFYVDPQYDPVKAPGAQPPFDVEFGSTDAVGKGTSCSPIQLTFYNREEQTSTTGTTFSPSPQHGNALCFESQVVSFNQGNVKYYGGAATKVLGSNLGTNIATSSFTTGWAVIGLTGTKHFLGPGSTVVTPAPAGVNVFSGLPVTGFSVTNYVNGTLVDSGGKNVLSNYTALYRHKFHRTCTNTTGSCT